MRRIVGVAAAALLVAVTSGTAGKLDVGGHRLRFQQKGKGEPVVVFDAGLGDAYVTWKWVWPRVTDFTRVFLYDRAGLGKSEPGPPPRTSSLMVDELHALLRGADVPPPYVLVGHSLGGLNARLFATRYPDEVAAIVLVDATPLSFPAREADLRSAESLTRSETLLALTPEGTRLELESVRRSAEIVRQEENLPDVPVYVLTSTRPEEEPRFRDAWIAMQKELARAVEADRHVLTDQSGHYIHYDEPELVIESIREAVDTVRATR